VDVIVKQTHTGVVAVDPVTVVNVKQAAQELTVCFRRQCPGLRTTLALNGIQAGNELQMPDAQFFQRSIDFLRAAGHRAVDHAQQVYFYVMLLQNMQCRGYTVPGALPLGRWYSLCHGGCKRDWVENDGKLENYSCLAFKEFFAYAESRILEIARAEAEYYRR